MPSRKIVTRFAPSPTGYLHIGGARTALFNWAFARRHGGTFILRMEDTDAARSTAESTRRIIEDLNWLGLEWDEGPDPDAADVYELASQKGSFAPYFQSQRGALYSEYLDRLRKLGRAYRCFKTPEQLKAEREAQKAAGRPMQYDPAEALNRSEADQQKLIDQGKPFVWRFRMPDQDATVHDLVLGDVTIKAAELEDFVIVKGQASGGGGPTFHFANVVDDATMQVTHVLRAQEHLMNTPKHVAMFDALGLARPQYAHMPLIFNADGTKMSKRDKAKAARAAAQAWIKSHPGQTAQTFADAIGPGPQLIVDFLGKKTDEPAAIELIVNHLNTVCGQNVHLPEIDVHDFRRSGYLPDVVLNYIALLGWSPEGKDEAGGERFGKDFVATHFAVERLGKANARFDRAKLLAFNAERLQKMPPEEFSAALKDYFRFSGMVAGGYPQMHEDAPRWALFARAYQQRTKTLREPYEAGQFFDPSGNWPIYDPKAVEKVLKQNGGTGLTVLRELLPLLEAENQWTSTAIHQLIEQLAAKIGRNMGDVAQPLRVAVSGSTVSPPINDTLVILGKQATLDRVRRCLADQPRP
jgi:glutamyl/glutaminyl-tRNA synthetase